MNHYAACGVFFCCRRRFEVCTYRGLFWAFIRCTPVFTATYGKTRPDRLLYYVGFDDGVWGRFSVAAAPSSVELALRILQTMGTLITVGGALAFVISSHLSQVVWSV